MADSDGPLSSLLVGSSSLEGVSFSGASGIRWARLGTAILGTVAVTVATGLTAGIQGFAEALNRYVSAISSFFFGGTETVPGLPFITRPSDGLIDVAVEMLLSIIRGAWSFSVAEYGVLAMPIMLVTVLATFWIVSQGINFLTGRYL